MSFISLDTEILFRSMLLFVAIAISLLLVMKIIIALLKILLLIEIVSTISKENHILFAYRMIHVYTMHHIRTFLHGPSFLSLLDTHNILSNSNTYKIILKTMWFTCNIGGDRFPRRIIPYLALITLNNITFNMVVLTLHLNINGCTNR